jgi:hypothetical protein
MKGFLSTRFGFFAVAAVVCASTWLVIDPAHRWVSIALAGLYAVLSVLFLLDEVGRGRPAARGQRPAEPPFAPPPPPGRG